MKEKEDKIDLERIIKAIDQAEEHLLGFNFGMFEYEKKTYDAVLMQLVNIGEMVNRLSEDFREKHSDFPWHEAVGMRNQIAHGYFDVDVKEVWKTATKDLSKLKEQIKKLL